MKQKMMALLAMLLVGATAATGCSSTVEGKSDAPSAAPAQSTASAAESTASLSGKLTLNGSTSMAKVCQALGEGFMEKYPQVTVALIGDLSRNLKDEEKPADFEIVQIAIDGIAVAVNPQNKVDTLTSEQIAKIYTGEITNWKDVGGADQKITVIGREATSGTRDGFESILKIKEKTKLAAELSSTGEVVSKVGSDPAAIGYISLDSVNESVKAVTVDNVKPSEDTVKDGTYKLQRPFIEIYKKGSDNELVKAWFDFIASSEGQKIIKEAGLVIK